MIKRKSAIWCMAVAMLAVSGCGKNVQTEGQVSVITTDDIKEENVVSVEADYELFEYDALKDEAVAIVKVEVLDELTSVNSLSEYDERFQATVSFCSVRQVRVLEVYKDNTGEISVGDEIEVQDDSAIYEENGEVYQDTYDNTPPLEKGSIYLLYLDDDKTMSGKLAIMSCENGRVNLTQVEQNDKFYDVAVKSIVEYESDMPEAEKEVILQAEEVYQITEDKVEEELEVSVETPSEEITISVGTDSETGEKIGVYLENE